MLSKRNVIYIVFAVAALVLVGIAYKKTIKSFHKFRKTTVELASQATNKDFFLDQQKKEVADLFTVYTVYDKSGELEYYRHGKDHDGGYVVPRKALQSAEAVLGYGILDDSSFEEQFSEMYKKPSYGFDCTVDYTGTNQLFTFVKECVASRRFIDKKHNTKFSSFLDHLNQFNLKGKKVFVKMDIEGGEYDALDEVLLNHPNVTGIVLEIHFNENNISEAIKLLKKLKRDFILVHVHGNNCTDANMSSSNALGKFSGVMELSYINKSLVSGRQVAKNQFHPTPLDMPNCKDSPLMRFEIIPNQPS